LAKKKLAKRSTLQAPASFLSFASHLGKERMSRQWGYLKRN
jgi:hypothetical protein